MLPPTVTGSAYSNQQVTSHQNTTNLFPVDPLSSSTITGSSPMMPWDLAALQEQAAAAEAAAAATAKAAGKLPPVPGWSLQLRQQHSLAGQQEVAKQHQLLQASKPAPQLPAHLLGNNENSTAFNSGSNCFSSKQQQGKAEPQHPLLQARKPLQQLAVNNQRQQQQPGADAKGFSFPAAFLTVQDKAAVQPTQQLYRPVTSNPHPTCQPTSAALDRTLRETSSSLQDNPAQLTSSNSCSTAHQGVPGAHMAGIASSTIASQVQGPTAVPAAAAHSLSLQERAAGSAALQQTTIASLLQQQECMAGLPVLQEAPASSASGPSGSAAAGIQRQPSNQAGQHKQQDDASGANMDSCYPVDAAHGSSTSSNSNVTGERSKAAERLAALDQLKSTLVLTRQALQEHAAAAAVRGPPHPTDPLFMAFPASYSSSTSYLGGAAVLQAPAPPANHSSSSMFQPLTTNVPNHQAAAKRLAATPSGTPHNTQHLGSFASAGRATPATGGLSCGRHSMQGLPSVTAAAALAHSSAHSGVPLHSSTQQQLAAPAGSAAAPAAPFHSSIVHTAAPFVRGVPQAAYQAAYAAPAADLSTQSLLEAVAATLQGSCASQDHNSHLTLHTAATTNAGLPQFQADVQPTASHAYYASSSGHTPAAPAASHSAQATSSSCGSCSNAPTSSRSSSSILEPQHPYQHHWQHRQRSAHPGLPGSTAAASSSILDPFTAVSMQQQTASTATSQQYGSVDPAQLQHFAGNMMSVPGPALITSRSAAAGNVSRPSVELARQAAAAAAGLAAAAQTRSRPGTPRYPGLEAAAGAQQVEDGSTAERWSHWKQAAGLLLQGARMQQPGPAATAAMAGAGAPAAPTAVRSTTDMREHQRMRQLQQQAGLQQEKHGPAQPTAAAPAPTASGSMAAETVRHAARALQRLRLKQAETAAAAMAAAAQKASTQAGQLAASAAADQAMPTASCESHAPRHHAVHDISWQQPRDGTASQPSAAATAGSTQGLSGQLLQQLQRLKAAALQDSQAARLAHVAACKAAGLGQVSDEHAVISSATAVGVSGSDELQQRQQLSQSMVKEAGGTAGNGDSTRCSSLSGLSHHTSSTQGRLDAMRISSGGSCSSSSSCASAEPDPEYAAKQDAADMQLPASVLEELLMATAAVDSKKDATNPAASTASAAAAAAKTPLELAAAAAAAVAAFAADADAAAAAAAHDDDDDDDDATPEARQQLPPAPAPHSRPSSALSTALCSCLADTAQSTLSYALPGHLLLRTPFVGLHADDNDYVAEAIAHWHGMDACKDMMFVNSSRYLAARKPNGAKKRLVWRGAANRHM